ncbi:MAG: nitroreductase family protein [Omnitrophica WOR_2 bacterium]
MKSNPVDTQDFLRSRRSVRRFLPQAVPDGLLAQILETSTWAPSAHNRQPWRFVVLKTPGSRLRLADEMGIEFRRDLMKEGLPEDEVEATIQRSRQRILDAPVAIVVCLDMSDMDIYSDQKRSHYEYIMAVQSVAMAGNTLLFAAHAAGLGGVWICAPLFTPLTITRIFKLPASWEAQGLVLLGYPAKIPEPRRRKSLNEITIYD